MVRFINQVVALNCSIGCHGFKLQRNFVLLAKEILVHRKRVYTIFGYELASQGITVSPAQIHNFPTITLDIRRMV